MSIQDKISAFDSAEDSGRRPEKAHWFWGDERFVAHDDPLSNYRMVREALLSPSPIPASNSHLIPTEGLSTEAAASAYAAELRSFSRWESKARNPGTAAT
jgi:6-phosphogluconolactonase/glucosamine-6-phosphate isomerase/deaminase